MSNQIKTLVLDANYKPISFIDFQRTVRLLFNDKIDIISNWDFNIYRNKSYPSIVRLRSYVRTKPIKIKFSFSGVVRRDRLICQYTGDLLTKDNITIDHITPKARGGISSWTNCCCCSKNVNRLKGSKTLEESGLELIRQPKEPTNPTEIEYFFIKNKHQDWKGYFNV
jgi:5-methylcytosine-specific restriction endonuclease McrA